MKNKKNNGMYGIIVGCVLVVALIGFAGTANIKKHIKANEPKTETANVAVTSKPKPQPTEMPETKPVQAAPVQTVKKQPTAEKSPQPTKKPEYVAPVDGKISVPFSKEPIYSKTFDDYRSHLALDIDAPKSTPVKAVTDGTVEKIYTDPLYGITIEIRHSDELVSKYSGLLSTELTETGKAVKAGEVISAVGTTGGAEKEQTDHLHFEMIFNGENKDPMDYLSE